MVEVKRLSSNSFGLFILDTTELYVNFNAMTRSHKMHICSFIVAINLFSLNSRGSQYKTVMHKVSMMNIAYAAFSGSIKCNWRTNPQPVILVHENEHRLNIA